MAPIVPYKEDPPKEKQSKKNDEGIVELDPPNFKVSPMKKGKHDKGSKIYFGGNIPYMESDYNMDKKIAKDELDYHNSKI